MQYRVEDLAREAGVSVELLRSYQSKGLLPAPRHEGRVAWYGVHHLDRLRTIRELKEGGHSLRAIARLIDPDADLSHFGDVAPEVPEDAFSLRELAEHSRVPPSMLRSLEASGVLRPRRNGEEPCYTSADVRAVRQLLSLIGGGLPMEEFMRVARVELEAIETIAGQAVALFLQYVREPLQTAGLPQKEEAERLAEAFRTMLHATTSLMAYNFQRAVLNAAIDELDRTGTKAERAALRKAASLKSMEAMT